MLLFYEVTYGSSVGSILWVFLWCILVRLGLRYRLLWFWVFGCAIPRVLPMGLGSG